MKKKEKYQEIADFINENKKMIIRVNYIQGKELAKVDTYKITLKDNKKTNPDEIKKVYNTGKNHKEYETENVKIEDISTNKELIETKGSSIPDIIVEEIIS